MRKVLFVVAMVLSSLAAMSSPAPVAAATYCPGIQCFQDSDCWAWCPGGVGASYCIRGLRQCAPY